MARTYEAPLWRDHVMSFSDPHRELEPLQDEVAAVAGALECLVEAGLLAGTAYDADRFGAHRAAVRENFEIPWTAITPRMQRLLYAVNAIRRPNVMVAVGILCGNTFISNAGAGVGPGAVYRPERSVGIEIRTEEADRARRNVATIDTDGVAEILGTDGIEWLRGFEGVVDLLYIDADGQGGKGKSIYREVVEAGMHALRAGSLVVAHNSVNSASELTDYLAFVRDPGRFRESVNIFIDDQGIEVSGV
jgi:predicted O-methyltransferase YrrM